MKTMVLLSGGIDSTTCLGLAVKRGGAEQTEALCVFYGQKHRREMDAARAVAAYYGVKLRELDLSVIFENSDSALLAGRGEIPKESYADQLADSEGSPVSTYVPFRNGLFLSAAASIALGDGCETLVYGAHADDAALSAYPDCSEAFVRAMGDAIAVGTANKLRLSAPFVSLTKRDVVAKGLEIGAPYHLTWSCYEGGETPCGRCGTCRDRARAFAENGVADPALREGSGT